MRLRIDDISSADYLRSLMCLYSRRGDKKRYHQDMLSYDIYFGAEDMINAYNFADWRRINQIRQPPGVWPDLADTITKICDLWHYVGDEAQKITCLYLLPIIFERLAQKGIKTISYDDILHEVDILVSSPSGSEPPPVKFLPPRPAAAEIGGQVIAIMSPDAIQDADIASALKDYTAYHAQDTIGKFDADGRPEQQIKRARWQQIFLSLTYTEREQQIPPDFAKKYIEQYKNVLAGWYYGEEIPPRVEII